MSDTGVANRERGEVDLTIAGTVYTLKLDLNALCEVESALSTGVQMVTYQQALRRVEQGSLSAVRAVLWAALRTHHPNMTLKHVGDLLLELGGMPGVEQVLKEAVEAMSPASSDQVAANPRKARSRGHGAPSTSEPDRSDSRAMSSGQ